MTRGSPHDVSDGKKLCPRCGVRKPFSEYPLNRRNFHGIATHCKPCTNEAQRQRRATPEGAKAHRAASKAWRDINKTRNKDNHAKWKYGLDHGGYDELFAQQGGRCKICRTDKPGSRLNRFHIDHSHSNGVIRGLLCEHCNRGLGHFKDDPKLLRAAATYVEGGG